MASIWKTIVRGFNDNELRFLTLRIGMLDDPNAPLTEVSLDLGTMGYRVQTVAHLHTS